MINKEEIAKIIYSYMGCVYCNNCRNKGNEKVCQWCQRNATEWEISEEFSKKVADAIIEVIVDDNEKQTPKKPSHYIEQIQYDGYTQTIFEYYFCPICGTDFKKEYDNFCGECGQALDWSDEK